MVIREPCRFKTIPKSDKVEAISRNEKLNVALAMATESKLNKDRLGIQLSLGTLRQKARHICPFMIQQIARAILICANTGNKYVK
jgi:hypothetical protein